MTVGKNLQGPTNPARIIASPLALSSFAVRGRDADRDEDRGRCALIANRCRRARLAARRLTHSGTDRGGRDEDVVLVGHHDPNGSGDGGEGLAIQLAHGRRITIAHEGQKMCLSTWMSRVPNIRC